MEGSPLSSEGHSPLYIHTAKFNMFSSQSPPEMCPHTPGSNFGEEIAETQSEFSDSSCGKFTFENKNVSHIFLDIKLYYII